MAQVEVLDGLEGSVGCKNNEKTLVFVVFSISSVLGYIRLSWSYVAPSYASRKAQESPGAPQERPKTPKRAPRSPKRLPEAPQELT